MVMVARPLPQAGQGALPRPPVSVDPILPGRPRPGVPPTPGIMPPRIQDEMLFAHKDKNRDGALSQEEFGVKPAQAMPSLMAYKERQEQLARFKKFDADGDGKVSKAEYTIGRHWERLSQKVDGWMTKPKPMPHPQAPSPFGTEVRPTDGRPAMERPAPQRPFGQDALVQLAKQG